MISLIYQKDHMQLQMILSKIQMKMIRKRKNLKSFHLQSKGKQHIQEESPKQIYRCQKRKGIILKLHLNKQIQLYKNKKKNTILFQ